MIAPSCMYQYEYTKIQNIINFLQCNKNTGKDSEHEWIDVNMCSSNIVTLIT